MPPRPDIDEECSKCGCRRETHPIDTCKEFVAHQSSQSKGESWEKDIWRWATHEFPHQHADKFERLIQVLSKLLSERDMELKAKIEGMMTSEFGDPERPFYGTVAARSHAKVHNAILKKVLELFSITHQ